MCRQLSFRKESKEGGKVDNRFLQVNLINWRDFIYVISNFGSSYCYHEYLVGKPCYNEDLVISFVGRFSCGTSDGAAG